MIQTVSLETARALNEAGFRQDTYFKWYESPSKGSGGKPRVGDENVTWDDYIICAAPSTDEILSELLIGSDEWTGTYRHLAMWPHSIKTWQCAYVLPDGEGYFAWQEGKSLPEALAKMWLWLKKEGIIK